MAPWNDDKLNRKEDAKYLTAYLLNRFTIKKDEPFVLNIDAEWGFGKTYFLTNWRRDLKSEGCEVVYFNAWEKDFTDNPLLGFISAIDKELKPFFDKKANASQKTKWNKFKLAAAPLLLSFIAKRLTGNSLNQINKLMLSDGDEDKATNKLVEGLTTQATNIVLEHQDSIEKSINTFKTNLGEIAKKAGNDKKPIFIFVDELDRCRPSYAIELLETIKHLFQIPRVYFVVATASEQLSHSIKAIYGNNFESKKYLNRFFDQIYHLPSPNRLSYSEYLWKTELISDDKLIAVHNNGNAYLLAQTAVLCDAGLRDIEQAVKILQAIQLTTKERLYTLPLAFLAILKISKPELYKITIPMWKNKFRTDTNQQNWDIFINKMNNPESNLYSKVASEGKIISVISKLLGKSGVKSTEIQRGTEELGDMILHDFSWNQNQEFSIIHYPELVERAGHFVS
ncbi:P-loop NTPase fold protein [Pseudoalteromonas sp. SK18]|uniref:KAP family P-loop NTPase fold protein n=1 Tax=Pseudoalteromonas sp. SK18 TaxID=1938366 RepID=UPI000975B454|nr:P-loop NTPase fold protein [Pseudoalteromonas sp. SK18]